MNNKMSLGLMGGQSLMQHYMQQQPIHAYEQVLSMQQEFERERSYQSGIIHSQGQRINDLQNQLDDAKDKLEQALKHQATPAMHEVIACAARYYKVQSSRYQRELAEALQALERSGYKAP